MKEMILESLTKLSRKEKKTPLVAAFRKALGQ